MVELGGAAHARAARMCLFCHHPAYEHGLKTGCLFGHVEGAYVSFSTVLNTPCMCVKLVLENVKSGDIKLSDRMRAAWRRFRG